MLDTDFQTPELIPLEVERVRRPVMTQFWADVVFLHWRFEPQTVQRLLPDGVVVDVYDGSAWVALVPFQMERLGLPGIGPLPVVGTFPEVNVRTYVSSGNRRGVWFFSLDIDQLLPTAVARAAYRLPYCYGTASHTREGDIITSTVDRRWPRPSPVAESDGTPGGVSGRTSEASAQISIRRGEPIDPGDPLVDFLTSRWGLISASRRGKLRYAPVDHPPWVLHSGELLHLDETLVSAAGLPAPTGEPHIMWSPGVDVRVGLPHRIDPRTAKNTPIRTPSRKPMTSSHTTRHIPSQTPDDRAVVVSTTIERSAAAVWADVRDIGSHVTWMQDAVAIRFLTDHTEGIGTSFECDTKVGPFSLTDVMEITSWEDERRMGVRHVGLVVGTGEFTLTPLTENVTEFRWEEDLSFPWWMGGALGAFVARPLLKQIWKRNLMRLKTRVEQAR